METGGYAAAAISGIARALPFSGRYAFKEHRAKVKIDVKNAEPARTRTDVARSRQRSARMLGLFAASCALDVVLLLGFALTATTSFAVPLLYATVSAVVMGLFWLAIKSGWSERFADPALTHPQIVASSVIELSFAAMFPRVGFYFLTLLFVVFSFGALRLRPRQAVLYWALISVAAAAVSHLLNLRMGLPNETLINQVLIGLCFSTALLRCTFVGLYGSHIRELLQLRNTQLAAASARVAHLADHDELTGALTRRPVRTLLEEQLRRDERTHAGLCVAMLDLDHFKSINDRYGHAVGDEVLRVFAATVRSLLRPHDAFARYGGEEFLLILETGNAQAAVAAVERIRHAVSALQWPGISAELRVSFSAGVARRAACGQRESRRTAAASRPRALSGQAGRPRPRRTGIGLDQGSASVSARVGCRS